MKFPLPALLLATCLLMAFSPTLTLFAAEDLATPPITTAKAWVIADGNTGEVLASHQPDEKLKSASTTKAMCAHVVLGLAKKDPAVLDEMVTISKLADATAGSTAGVKAGEKISVRDGLRGLMLPSGNDMGNAFAEHFHARLQPPGKETPDSVKTPGFRTRCNFIAEMNREAIRLGMKNTVYRQSYGDGGEDKDPTTTARDLVILAIAAMKDPAFAEVVKTQKYTGKVLLPGSTTKTRDITWENSNQLLKLGGYDGVKTGMTNQAGYCLIARGEQNGMPLIVTILGAPSEEVRYAEVRNLFRWWWSSGRTVRQ
ncbi:D-alanyl-D-alanine carboxypeptidase (penicillin-binding protein 5/6) [Roseimicrobium gellanilyticum]|uniref:D-alanyl-D-alanine carboxypeptidase (Penicillin-binding protein 5/6) n=1 Tax=Roseimicrobium gellanilyticum TaxID=748857 RepID=A0A366HTT9_9BACT|nr:serine hydrolase [Roseimicrobium gellanilyticum]RBP46117.1 D-alanyl-D-alanine carboxypeptidase (penicillin-binding protein 5/6) [Roseimicrobium gellanilyticum]